MNATPKFTIVLAGYQCEPYLPKTLDSIVKQTFCDFEVICYVEESTDNSLTICQTMANQDSRFTVVSAPKSGAVSSTRNYGIDHASGEYLVVLDGDDWIGDDMLEKLYQKLKQPGPIDVLAFAFTKTTADGVGVELESRQSNFRVADDVAGVFSGMDAIRRVCNKQSFSFFAYTWLNIYRVDFLRENRLYQKTGMLMEDFEWAPRVWFLAQRFAYIDEVFYFYRCRPNSITTHKSSRLVFDFVCGLQSFLEFVSHNSIPDDIQAIWSNQWLCVLFYFLFHPISNHIADVDRKEILQRFFEKEYSALFRKFVFHASIPRRMAFPFLWLATKGFQLPAKLFFGKLYYPFVERRERRRRH